MTTAIDAAGRIVIPKALRDRLGLVPGRALDVRERDGRIEIEPAPSPMSLVQRRGGLVAVPDEDSLCDLPEVPRGISISILRRRT